MRRIISISEMQRLADSARRDGKRISFVPTMGYLHEGHLDLLRAARSKGDVLVMSIFVNPTQFAPDEDLDTYPRDLERDARLADETGCDILFLPGAEEMYPEGFRTSVQVAHWSGLFEGAVRPTHFSGVATVVAKLLNIVKPHAACFGQKDAQQALILRRMVRDLNIDVEMIIVPTRREADGLAMSSRNTYLSPSDRERALVLSRSLLMAQQAFHAGERSAEALKEIILTEFATVPDVVPDYVAVLNASTFEEAPAPGADILIALAAKVGSTRLIDNVILSSGQVDT